MKSLFLCLFFFLCFLETGIAQVVVEDESVSVDDLKKYATVEAKTAEFLLEKTEELRNLILMNEEIKGGARFNEIKSAWGNDSKMAKAQVSAVEITAYQQILNHQSTLQQSIVDYKSILIKNEDVLGIALYNKVTSAIKEDPVMKEKLDQMVQDLKGKPSK